MDLNRGREGTATRKQYKKRGRAIAFLIARSSFKKVYVKRVSKLLFSWSSS